MTSKELTKLAVAALEDRKAEDVTVIDISEISPIADYFIIANGTNQNQLQAMRDAADEALYKAGVKVQQIEGNQSSTWILMDYGDIIIHIFSKEDRLFYDLERTWRDGKVVDVSELYKKLTKFLSRLSVRRSAAAFCFLLIKIIENGIHQTLFLKSNTLLQ